MTDLPTARTTVATRLRASAPGQPDAARIEAAADMIERGEDDAGYAMRAELKRMEAERG